MLSLSLLLALAAHAQDATDAPVPTDAADATLQPDAPRSPVFRVEVSGTHADRWTAARVAPDLRANVSGSVGVIAQVQLGLTHAALSATTRRALGVDARGISARGGGALLGVGPRWGRVAEGMLYVGAAADTWGVTGASYRALAEDGVFAGPATYGYGPAAGALAVVPLSQRLSLRADTGATWLERRLKRRSVAARDDVPPVNRVDADALASDRLKVATGLEAQVALGEALALAAGLEVQAEWLWFTEGVGTTVEVHPRLSARWAL